MVTANSTDLPAKLVRPPVWQEIDGIPTWQFALRLLWVAVQIAASMILMFQIRAFFYQGF